MSTSTVNPAERRVGRTYELDQQRPGAGYFQVETRQIGRHTRYVWAWYEANEEADVSQETYPTPSAAVLAAADNAEESIAELDDGLKLARRMRASARMLAKSEARSGAQA